MGFALKGYRKRLGTGFCGLALWTREVCERREARADEGWVGE